MTRVAAAAAVAALAACTSPSLVPADDIARLPVVKAGEALPTSGDYVLYYPAGQALPLELQARGTLFAAPGLARSSVTLTRDLYLFRDWASYDQRRWTPTVNLLGISLHPEFDGRGVTTVMRVDAR